MYRKRPRAVSKTIAVLALIVVIGAVLVAFVTFGLPASSPHISSVIRPLFPGALIVSQDISQLNYSVSINPLNNKSADFSLSVRAQQGISATFSPSILSVSGSGVNVTLQISVANSTALGSYQITLIASNDNSTYTKVEEISVIKDLVVTVGTRFVPQNLTVLQGSRVTWLRLNGALGPEDDGSHDVDFSSGTSYVSPTLAQYATWSFIFNATGSYNYYCKFHPFMTGDIIVVPQT